MRKLLLVVGLAIAGCDDLLRIDAEVEEICIRHVGDTVPGTGAFSDAPVSGSFSASFPLEVGDVADLLEDELAATLHVLDFRMTAQNGALSGLERISVRLEAPRGSGLPPLKLVDFPARAGDPPVTVEGDVLSVDLAEEQHDLLEYVDAGQLTLRLEAKGTLPADDWRAEFEICAAASAT